MPQTSEPVQHTAHSVGLRLREQDLGALAPWETERAHALQLPGLDHYCDLLAEDSITTRTQEPRILEGAGCEVVTAVDGLEARNKLATRAFDAVVTDVLMPNLGGLGFAEKIRRAPRYAKLPIIFVTSLASDADKQRRLEVGANAHITKPAFDQKILLDCLQRLI